MKEQSFVVVGKLASTYGIRGWLRVFSFTENESNLFEYSPWYIKQNNQWKPLEVEGFKPHNQDMIVKLKGIDDREHAQLLTNLEIYVDSSLFTELESGDYYWKDLIGCRVVTTKGYDLGIVTELLETGSNDVLVVKANLKDAFGKKERLLPFVEGDCIKNVDLKLKNISVDWDPDF